MPFGPIIVEAMRNDSTRMDVQSHNLANSHTSGYRALIPVHDGSNFHTAINQMAAHHRETGNPLDFTIEGDGYFVVDRNGQKLMTRNGSFHIDREGYLVNHDGFRVQSQSGDIRLNPEAPVEVDKDGTIRQSQALVGKFMMVKPTGNVRQAGGACLLHEEGKDWTAATGCEVHNARVEHSNVNPLTEMTDFLSVTRTFELGQKALHVEGDVNRKLTEEVGRTR
ncbi:MAG: flagellar hook basal-body protein [Armatimonadetes bacterium]|nr:flagellar hook basal-body protein [Armatimonadota bacterium]